jgi:hypothetical protein
MIPSPFVWRAFDTFVIDVRPSFQAIAAAFRPGFMEAPA